MDGRAYMLEEMTWPEAKEALAQAKLALVPVGSLEQHGPHLAMSADAVSAYDFSRLLAERVYPRAVVTAPISFGVSSHHMDFPGTVTLRPETLVAIAVDIGVSLKHHGLSHVLFVNGHGGNRDALGVATTNLRFDHGVKAGHVLWELLARGEALSGLSTGWLGHSCEIEVSVMMHLRGDRVRTEALVEGKPTGRRLRYLLGGVSVPVPFSEITENGAFGGAPHATAERGAAIVEEALRRVAEFVEDFTAEREAR